MIERVSPATSLPLRAAALGVVLASAGVACNPGAGPGPESDTSLYAAISQPAGFYFYPPLGPAPEPTGTFQPGLLDRLEVVLLDAEGRMEPVVFNASSDPRLIALDKHELYFVNVPAAAYVTDPSLAYRFSVRFGGRELAWSDLSSRVFELLATNPAFRIGVRLRIEPAALDLDGDGIFDVDDACPELFDPTNPPAELGCPPPGSGCSDRDATCDGVDDDCDGLIDEDFAATETRCGAGGCVRTGALVCADGVITDTCVAGAPGPTDDTCDLVDDDCDRMVDEDCPLPERADPSAVATPLPSGEVPSFADSSAFLYGGSDPIQLGVAPGTITPARAAVIRGRVLDRDGAPLADVHVFIADHPELGYTRSRSDGRWDLAINGGGALTVQLHRAGYLGAQRNVEVPWQDFTTVDDVALIPLDPAATVVDLGAEVPVLATGTTVVDAAGERTGRVLFPAGTEAEVVLGDGRTVPLESLTVHITEYTVGEGGPAAMPGSLPETSEYTYAVELTVLEADLAGGTGVTFATPVPYYVDNFLGLPAGARVPVGYYERSCGCWRPSPDGRVILIMTVAGGVAQLDADGDGLADDEGALEALGITTEEREILASTYSAGDSIWRAPLTHFSPYDLNFPGVPPPGAEPPPPSPPQPIAPPSVYGPAAAPEGFGTVDAASRTFREELALAGSGARLTYASDRTPGRRAGRTFDIAVTGDVLHPELLEVQLEIAIAGRVERVSHPLIPGQVARYTWDGRDAYGRIVNGTRTAKVSVVHFFPGYIALTPEGASGFGLTSGTAYPGLYRTRLNGDLARTYEIELSSWDDRGLGLGGWRLSELHSYDPEGRTLREGDGTVRSVDAEAVGPTITTVLGAAGEVPEGGDPDGLPGTETHLDGYTPFTVGPDGSLYYCDRYGGRIRRLGPDGVVRTFAGTGVQGMSGDGGPALSAEVFCQDLAMHRDGSLYFINWGGAVGGSSIRRIDPDGRIHTVAGAYGADVFNGLDISDEEPAATAEMMPVAIAVAPDCSIYLLDAYGSLIRKITTDGVIRRIAGLGGNLGAFYDIVSESGDGGPAIDAPVGAANGLALGPDGSLYWTEGFQLGEFGSPKVRRLSADGIVRRIAGNGQYFSFSPGPIGDFGPPTEAELTSPGDVALGPDGSTYILEGSRVRRIGADGIITTWGGLGLPAPDDGLGDGLPIARARFDSVSKVEVGPDGSVYLMDPIPGRIRRVAPSLPGLVDDGGFVIPSRDGTAVFTFDGAGRHLTTRSALTGAVLLAFERDGAGRLASITDVDGNVAVIERGSGGAPVAFVSAFGARTTFTVGPDGFLSSVGYPDGSRVELTTDPDGLLLGITGRLGDTHAVSYDADGSVTGASDLAGSVALGDPAGSAEGFTLIRRDGASVTRAHEETADGAVSIADGLPWGGTLTISSSPDGKRAGTLPSGLGSDVTGGPSVLFGMQAPIPALANITMGGRTTQVSVTQHAEPAGATLETFTNLSTIVTVDGRSVTSSFDRATLTTSNTSATGRSAFVQQDAAGRVTAIGVDGLEPTTVEYDAQGRLAAMRAGAGASVRESLFSWDASGHLRSVRDALGRVVELTYDAMGRPTHVLRPGAGETLYGYDARGNRTSVTPPGLGAFTEGFDVLGRRVSRAFPDLGDGPDAIATAWDAAGRVSSVTDAEGRTLSYGYDAAGRLVELGASEATIALMYDPGSGLLAGASRGAESITLVREVELVTSVVVAGSVAGQIDLAYGPDLRPSSWQVAGAQPIELAWNDDDLLVAAGPATFTYGTALATPTELGVGGTSELVTLGALGEIESRVVTGGAGVIWSAQYTRDPKGRVIEVVETSLGTPTTLGYAYDEADRLEVVERDHAVWETFGYTLNGDRTSSTHALGGPVAASFDARGQLLAQGGAEYEHDRSGRRVRRSEAGQVVSYGYDTFGNLETVALADGREVTYTLDALGRRLEKRVDGELHGAWLYFGPHPAAALDASGAITSVFVRGPDEHLTAILAGGGTYRVVTDLVGSVRLVIDAASGAIVQQLDYDAFGRVTLDTNPGFQPFGFAGGLHDPDTGLVHLGAREYDPETGRFTSRDPLFFASGETNLYTYAANDPVNQIDPSGTASSHAPSGATGAQPGAPTFGGGAAFDPHDRVPGAQGLYVADDQARAQLTSILQAVRDAPRSMACTVNTENNLAAVLRVMPSRGSSWGVVKVRFPGVLVGGPLDLGAHSALVVYPRGGSPDDGLVLDGWWGQTRPMFYPKWTRPGGWVYDGDYSEIYNPEGRPVTQLK